MKVTFFVHALASCWNNGNAHFLRGVVTALQRKGHEVAVFEPRSAWSRHNLLADHGPEALDHFAEAFPMLRPRFYDPALHDPEVLIGDSDLVVVHEWNEPEFVNRLGRIRAQGGDFVLLFHDTHHRAATSPEEMGRFELDGFDGVLAFGTPINDIYRSRGWAKRVWTWHEAADTSVFYPRQAQAKSGDLVWVGNWGDEERSEEIREFLVGPAEALRLSADVYGVRYPESAVAELESAGIRYRGWLANHLVPEVFSRYRLTVHVPRRPYARALPGIPTIRVFEALACGIPLVSAPWSDAEHLFPPDCFLLAENGSAMREAIRAVLADQALARRLADNGLAAIRSRHTCDHRADELLAIYSSLAPSAQADMTRKAV
jgi:spore maturation protein CgeB